MATHAFLCNMSRVRFPHMHMHMILFFLIMFFFFISFLIFSHFTVRVRRLGFGLVWVYFDYFITEENPQIVLVTRCSDGSEIALCHFEASEITSSELKWLRTQQNIEKIFLFGQG